MPPETAIQPTASLALRSGYKRSMGGGIKHSSAVKEIQKIKPLISKAR